MRGILHAAAAAILAAVVAYTPAGASGCYPVYSTYAVPTYSVPTYGVAGSFAPGYYPAGYYYPATVATYQAVAAPVYQASYAPSADAIKLAELTGKYEALVSIVGRAAIGAVPAAAPAYAPPASPAAPQSAPYQMPRAEAPPPAAAPSGHPGAEVFRESCAACHAAAVAQQKAKGIVLDPAALAPASALAAIREVVDGRMPPGDSQRKALEGQKMGELISFLSAASARR